MMGRSGRFLPRTLPVRVGTITGSLAGAVLGGLLATMASASDLSFSLPIACEIGPGCQVQNYVDDDTGPAARDHACGGLTYDRHTGTDFRVVDETDAERGVDVRAAAEGTVRGVRDGMADVNIRIAGLESVKDRECGNGVVIDHGDGWETQYCHLRKGSVAVRAGERVERGARLGSVGISGAAAFPHVHFEVRRNRVPIDPFTAEPAGTPDATACTTNGPGLWDGAAAATLAYRDAALLIAGFSEGPLDLAALEKARPAAPTRSSPALVAYVRVLGVRAGDQESLTLVDPAGSVLVERKPTALAANMVQWLAFSGSRRSAGAWPPGEYKASYRLERGGKTILDHAFSIEIR